MKDVLNGSAQQETQSTLTRNNPDDDQLITPPLITLSKVTWKWENHALG